LGNQSINVVPVRPHALNLSPLLRDDLQPNYLTPCSQKKRTVVCCETTNRPETRDR